MTAPMVDYKIHWLKMMSVPESRAVVGRHDGINGRDNRHAATVTAAIPISICYTLTRIIQRRAKVTAAIPISICYTSPR